MKRIALTFLCLILLFPLAGQDQLFRNDNSKLLVKILEVGPQEIRYKLHDNPNGPVYLESRKNVSLIIYENGEHQVITQGSVLAAEPAAIPNGKKVIVPEMKVYDSLTYYRHSNSISLNFLNFFNNEVAIIYRREFFSSQFNIIIPFAFGVADPAVTQNFYFNSGPVKVVLGNKVMEAGFGIHYYPSLRTNANYYIGPVVRYMQYNCTQEALSYVWGYPIASNSTTLNRYAFSITNGLICRTRSRLTTNFFASIGFKNDQVSEPLKDGAGNTYQTVPRPLSLYWWSGFEVGFNF